MFEEIVISGNGVLLRNVEEVKRINVDEFYASLTRSVMMETPILSERVIYYAAKEERKLFVTHKGPGREKLNVLRDGGGDDTVKTYEISLPHVYMFHLFINSAFDQLYVYGANETLRDTNGLLLKLPLKNLHLDCKVCLGNDLRFNLEGSFHSKMLRVERHFWDSTFNSDLDSFYLNAIPSDWKSKGDPIEHWADLSIDDAFDPCKINWAKHIPWHAAVKAILKD